MAKRIAYVGETVHYYSFPPSTHPGPQAAIVAFVWQDDESVNLAVIDPHGSMTQASSVDMLQPGQKPQEKLSYCEFITDEDKNPDVDIKKNNDGNKTAPTGAGPTGAGANPYASGPKP